MKVKDQRKIKGNGRQRRRRVARPLNMTTTPSPGRSKMASMTSSCHGNRHMLEIAIGWLSLRNPRVLIRHAHCIHAPKLKLKFICHKLVSKIETTNRITKHKVRLLRLHSIDTRISITLYYYEYNNHRQCSHLITVLIRRRSIMS